MPHTADLKSSRLKGVHPAEQNAHARTWLWRKANGLERHEAYVAYMKAALGVSAPKTFADLEAAFWASASAPA